MKVVFIQNAPSYNIGITSLNAILKSDGIRTDIFVMSLEKDIVRKVIRAKPDLIGISCISGEQALYLDLIRGIKKYYNVPVVVGGPHATYYSTNLCRESGIDYVCIGEGEQTILELCRALASDRDTTDIPNLCMFRHNRVIKNPLLPLIENLDSLPFPDIDFYFKYPFFQKYTEMPVIATRGCPWSCSFCYNAQKRNIYKGLGKYVRWRTPVNIIAELKEKLSLNKNIKSVILYDDIIGIDKNWLKVFCEKYAEEIGLPFFANIRADLVNDYSLALLKKANCACLSMGVESGDQLIRSEVLGKNIENKSFLNAGRLVRKYGIKLRTSNMFLLPKENLVKALSTVELNQQMGVEIPFAYILQPYPGTPIYNYMVREKLLDDDFCFDSMDPLGLLYSYGKVKIAEADNIKTIYRLFYYMVKSPFLCGFIEKIIKKLKPENFFVVLAHKLSLLIVYCKTHNINYFTGLRITFTYWNIDRRAKKYICQKNNQPTDK